MVADWRLAFLFYNGETVANTTEKRNNPVILFEVPFIWHN